MSDRELNLRLFLRGQNLIADALDSGEPFGDGVAEVATEPWQYGAIVAELVADFPDIKEGLIDWIAEAIDRYIEL